MSNPTYINHDQLAEMMRSDATAGRDYAVVDVRGAWSILMVAIELSLLRQRA